MGDDRYDAALRDPQASFASPEEILESSWSPAQKRALLERWQEGSAEHGEPGLLTRLGRALAFLDTESGRHDEKRPQGLYGAIDDIPPRR